MADNFLQYAPNLYLGFGQGLWGAGSQLAGFAEATANELGIPLVERAANKARKYAESAAQAFAQERTGPENFTDISGLGDALAWGQGSLGQGLGSALPALAAGSVGGPVGLGGMAYAQATGGVQNQIREQGNSQTPVELPGIGQISGQQAGFGLGVPLAGLEMLAGPERGLVAPLAGNVVSRMGKQALGEAGTEAVQSGIQQAGVSGIGGTPTLNPSQMLNEGMAALPAGALGGIPRQPSPTQQPVIDPIGDQAERVSFELTPGDGSPFSQLYPEIAEMEPGLRAEVSKEVLANVHAEAVKLTGAQVEGVTYGWGGWEDHDPQPAVVTRIAAGDHQTAVDYARTIGYLAQQTEVWVNTTNDQGPDLAVDFIDRSGQMLNTDEGIKAAWAAIRQADPTGSLVGFQPTEIEGMPAIRVLLPGGIERMGDVQMKIEPALMAALPDDLEMVYTPAQVTIVGNDWNTDGDGNGYLTGLQDRFGAELVERLRTDGVGKAAGAIRQALERHGVVQSVEGPPQGEIFTDQFEAIDQWKKRGGKGSGWTIRPLPGGQYELTRAPQTPVPGPDAREADRPVVEQGMASGNGGGLGPRVAEMDTGDAGLRDPEGRPLAAQVIAGRRTRDGKDTPVSFEETQQVARSLTDGIINTYLSGAHGQVRNTLPGGGMPPSFLRLEMNQDLLDRKDAEQYDKTFRHETGHVIDFHTRRNLPPAHVIMDDHLIPNRRFEAGTDQEYHQIVQQMIGLSRRRRPELWAVAENQNPVTGFSAGYDAETVGKYYGYVHDPRELMADAIHSYMYDPAGTKRRAPAFARWLRDIANTNPTTKDIIQFNSILFGLVAASMGDDEEGASVEDRV